MNIEQITNCKIAGNVIVLVKLSNEPYKTWLVKNKKGTWLGSISNGFGWEYHPYNDIGVKVETWMRNRYQSDNPVLKFIEEFWI